MSNFKVDYSVEEEEEKSSTIGTIRQSPHDDREYKYLTLDNNLRVTLLSDENTQKAAAAMDVFVGCLTDPEDIPGLAHLLEHMLFMGSEKFRERTRWKICSRNTEARRTRSVSGRDRVLFRYRTEIIVGRTESVVTTLCFTSSQGRRVTT